MNAEDSKIVETDESQNVHQSVDKSRRSFSKSGLIAPVIMTLANRSAWGANACIGSGFQSYSAAVKNGQTLSHAAPITGSGSPYASWKTPSEWFLNYQDWPWQNTISVNNRITPMRRHPNNNTEFQRWGLKNDGSDVPAWRPGSNKTGLAESVARNEYGKSFLDQLLGSGYSNTVTIYEQLQEDHTNLLAYQIATAMNLLTYPLTVPTPNFAVLTKEEFELFYNNCV